MFDDAVVEPAVALLAVLASDSWRVRAWISARSGVAGWDIPSEY